MTKESISEHARALSVLGAAKGGKARAEKMSNKERRDVARAAAVARWGGVAVQATHGGELEIAGQTLACAVLEDGRRVLTQETFLQALGRSPKGKGGQKVSSPDGLPPFLSAETIKPFVTEELRQATAPIVFRSTSGRRSFGYEANLLPMVCEVYLKARDAGKTTKQQERIVAACDVLMRGLARVGIIALVDEATGFQYDRSRDALEQILKAFISKDLLKWVQVFPSDFYRELFRLMNWTFDEFSRKRPVLAGKLTKDLVYERLAPGVLQELERISERDDKGRLKHKYHQRLTKDFGHPKLKEHLASLVTLMRASDDWPQFKKMVDRALPKYKAMPLFDRDDGVEQGGAEAVGD